MSMTTKGFKISEEFKEKVDKLIEDSGMDAKVWFERLVGLYELQQQKEVSPEYAEDIAELELHTHRINELVLNMMKRAEYKSQELTKKIDEVKESKDKIIFGYQQDLTEHQLLLQEKDELINSAIEEKEKAEKRYLELENINQNNLALINEYKEKIDTLSGLINEYKGYAEQYQSLQKQLQTIQNEKNENEHRLNQLIQKQTTQIKSLEQELHELKAKHEYEINRIIETSNLDKEKALLELRAEYQEKLQQANEEYNLKVRSLYEELENVRKRNAQLEKK